MWPHDLLFFSNDINWVKENVEAIISKVDECGGALDITRWKYNIPL